MSDFTTKLLDRQPINFSVVSAATEAEVVVIFAEQTGERAKIIASDLEESTREFIEKTLEKIRFTGSKDSIGYCPHLPGELSETSFVVIGLGELEASYPSPQFVRHGAGEAVRALKGYETLTFDLSGADSEQVKAAFEGASLGAYEFLLHKSSPTPQKLQHISFFSPQLTEKEILQDRLAPVRGVWRTRDLVNTSPLQLFPESFADYARKAAKKSDVKVTVIDDDALAKDGYGGLTSVGRGSSRGPRLVKLEYSPSSALKHVSLVGKGITFDTGGISIKPASGMEEMKSDMAGAATVLSTVLAVAELGLPLKLTGYLALAENMSGSDASRPGDIITIFGGKTVEVLNTDAEGRLVMADALAAASQEQPDVLIDIATLTGAALVALGKRTAGLMGDEKVTADLFAASQKTDEGMWIMPLPEELRAGLDSTQADIANVGAREGGMLAAAVFLEEFVGEVEGEKIPWAHIDIAGPSFNSSSPYGHVTKEGTGFAVRTLVEYARSLC